MATHSYKENINRVRNANASRPSRLCRFGERSWLVVRLSPPSRLDACQPLRVQRWVFENESSLAIVTWPKRPLLYTYLSFFICFITALAAGFLVREDFLGADPPTPRSLCPVGDEVPHSSVCLMVLSSVNKRNSTRNRARPNLGDGKEAIYTL